MPARARVHTHTHTHTHTHGGRARGLWGEPVRARLELERQGRQEDRAGD